MQQQLRLEYATLHRFRVWRSWHAKSQSQSATIENILQVHFKYLAFKKTHVYDYSKIMQSSSHASVQVVKKSARLHHLLT